MMILRGISFVMIVFLTLSCGNKKSNSEFCKEELQFACEQTKALAQEAMHMQKLPRTLTENGEMHWAHTNFDWTEGFFPGTCWYLYEFSNQKVWKNSAVKLQDTYKSHSFFTTNHDLGFVFNCSYGNGYRLEANSQMKQTLVNAGNSLLTRFNPAVGCIQSWDVDGGWQAKRGWQYPVIIDNMMNLELLFELTKITGDDKYKEIAIAHANTTLKNHFRPDGSSYHVIDYDSISGSVRAKETAQGYAHESAWSRGQAWGLYGYTVCYRYTKDVTYLNKAKDIAKFYFNHKNLPEDHIPYWDFNAPNIPNEPKDASAAAVVASALVELSSYTDGAYINEARYILEQLSSENYKADLNDNSNFILKHSVGSIPHNNEIDVPLVYADYYYVEALMRLKDTKQTTTK